MSRKLRGRNVWNALVFTWDVSMRVTFCIMAFPIFRSKNCLFLSDIKSLVEMMLIKGSLNRVCCKKLTSNQIIMIKSYQHYNYNHRQKSWAKFALLALFHTCHTRTQLHLPSLSSHATKTVEN